MTTLNKYIYNTFYILLIYGRKELYFRFFTKK
jgi:hypothetical protein